MVLLRTNAPNNTSTNVIMKRTFFIMLVGCMLTLTLSAQSLHGNSSGHYLEANVVRTVLFTMNPSEYFDEINFKDDKHYSIVTYQISDRGIEEGPEEYDYCLILNGERKFINTNPLNICNLYYDDFSKCIYEYIDPNKKSSVFVKMGDRSYGPYDRVCLKPRKYPYGNDLYNRTSFEHYQQGKFEFWYGDEHFVYENDGFVHSYSKSRKEYISSNKKYVVTITEGNPLLALKINGRSYNLTNALRKYNDVNYCVGCTPRVWQKGNNDPKWFTDMEEMSARHDLFVTDCCIFDDGTCIYRIERKEIPTGLFDSYDFYIRGDSVRLIANHIYDIEKDSNGEFVWNEEKYDYERYSCFEYYDRASNSIKKRIILEDNDCKKCRNVELLVDKTKKHHFIIDHDRKIAFIDNKTLDFFPTEYRYRKKENDFQWISIEGREVVYYTYSLTEY